MQVQEISSLQGVAREIELSCFKSSERAQNKSLVPHDCPLLTQLYEPGLIEVISENDSKAISPFDNTGTDSELKCENFLQDIITISKSKTLTESAYKHLLCRKLQSGARPLLDSHLDLHSIEYANISLKDTIRLTEHLFMQKSNPRAALLSLTKIPKNVPQ